jgi:heptosyltransferase-2
LDRLFTQVLTGGQFKHEVEKNLDLLRFAGGNVTHNQLEVWLEGSDDLFAEKLLQKHGVPRGALLLALAPGAGHPRRMWPISNYIELANWFHESFKGSLLVLGNKQERALGEALSLNSNANVINAVGETSLREAAALLKRCRLFVGNDAGPMHLAAAVGLPVIEVSCHPLKGSQTHVNSPARFGPWPVPQVILRPVQGVGSCSSACISGQAHCITSVTVEHAKEALAGLLM